MNTEERALQITEGMFEARRFCREHSTPDVYKQATGMCRDMIRQWMTKNDVSEVKAAIEIGKMFARDGQGMNVGFVMSAAIDMVEDGLQ